MTLYYHLRITLLETDDDESGSNERTEEAEQVVKSFMTKNEKYIERSIFGYEYKHKSQGLADTDWVCHNHHVHGHIQFKPDFKHENVRYYLKTKHPSKYNFEPVKTTPDKNELYVCKEMRLIKGIGYTDEDIEQIWGTK